MKEFGSIKYIPLTQAQKNKLSEIEELLQLIPTITDNSQLEPMIRKLSKNHVVLKSFLSDIVKKTTDSNVIARVEDMNKRALNILNPIYDRLTADASEHCTLFYYRLKKAMGDESPSLHEYQQEEIIYFLRSIIRKEFSDKVYTLLMSRGSGKTYILSIAITFILLHWDRYIYHSQQTDYAILVTAPYEKQIDSFRRYMGELLSVAKAIGMISTVEGESSELGLYEYKNNKGEYVLRTQTGNNYSMILSKVAGESLESAHVDLAILDEAKMIEKQIFLTSLLPTLGGRSGILLCISSASNKHCYFQELVVKNCEFDYELKENGRNYIKYDGKFNQVGYDHFGETLFVKNFRTMIRDNFQYVQTIGRFLDTIGADISDIDNVTDESWRSQYENIFSSSRTSTFFDIGDLDATNSFSSYSPSQYIGNKDWNIVAGWDVAVDGDNSVVTIKAVENKVGLNKKSILLYLECLNPKKDPVSESTYNQVQKVIYFIQLYGIKSICIDTTGLGKGLDLYLKDCLKSQNLLVINFKDIHGIQINSKSRFELLEFYHKRLSTGYEVLPNIDSSLKDEVYQKRKYGISANDFTEDGMYVKFIHEHSRFSRIVGINKNTGIEYIIYEQEKANYLHDDMIFSSALASYCININPNMIKMNTNPAMSNQKVFNRATRNRRFR